MSVLLDTNIPIRHLTGDPPALARRATAFLESAPELVLTDVIFAETVYVLESFYERPRTEVGPLLRSLLALGSVAVADQDLLLRSLELYESAQLDFAEAYLAAVAEVSGIGGVASFDRTLDRVSSVSRIEP